MWILFLIFMCSIAQADVYVITAPDKSVYSLSEQDDAVLPDGYIKNIVPNKHISDLVVSMGEEKLYDFDKGTFILNSKKVQDKNKVEQDVILASGKITDDRQSGLSKLKGLGLTDDELKALFK